MATASLRTESVNQGERGVKTKRGRHPARATEATHASKTSAKFSIWERKGKKRVGRRKLVCLSSKATSAGMLWSCSPQLLSSYLLGQCLAGILTHPHPQPSKWGPHIQRGMPCHPFKYSICDRPTTYSHTTHQNNINWSQPRQDKQPKERGGKRTQEALATQQPLHALSNEYGGARELPVGP